MAISCRNSIFFVIFFLPAVHFRPKFFPGKRHQFFPVFPYGRHAIEKNEVYFQPLSSTATWIYLNYDFQGKPLIKIILNNQMVSVFVQLLITIKWKRRKM